MKQETRKKEPSAPFLVSVHRKSSARKQPLLRHLGDDKPRTAFGDQVVTAVTEEIHGSAGLNPLQNPIALRAMSLQAEVVFTDGTLARTMTRIQSFLFTGGALQHKSHGFLLLTGIKPVLALI